MRAPLLLVLLAACSVAEPTSSDQSEVTTTDAGICLTDELERCREARDFGTRICDLARDARQFELWVHKAPAGGFFDTAAKELDKYCYQQVADAYAACEVTACDAYAQTQP